MAEVTDTDTFTLVRISTSQALTMAQPGAVTALALLRG